MISYKYIPFVGNPERNDDADIPLATSLVERNPTDSTPIFVTREAVDLLVMGSICRTGEAGLPIGSTLKTVLV